MQISYANCLARLPSAWLRFSGKKGNLSHVTIDPVLGTKTIDYIIAKHWPKEIQILPSGCKKMVNDIVLLTSQRNLDDYCRIVYSRAAILCIALKNTFELLCEPSRLYDFFTGNNSKHAQLTSSWTHISVFKAKRCHPGFLFWAKTLRSLSLNFRDLDFF